ncbi:hypothetical protein [Variovorax sp. KK3]|uniref:hypothetical protein n=1 Tax=Variovorax sp. KK3 TaxID=1855728 RepID=UPI00097C4E1B|nr:hypothetical protein [Variovorax sp. KK3]
MKAAITLAVLMLWGMAAAAQDQAAPAPAPPIASPASAPTAGVSGAAPAAMSGGAPIVVTLPDRVSIKIDGMPQPSTGPGWFTSAVLAALVTAIASLIGIIVAANKRRDVESELQNTKLGHELSLHQARQQHELVLQQVKDDAADALAAKDRQLQAMQKARDQDIQETHQFATLSREDQRIELERERLRRTTGASDIDIEVSAVKLAREHGSTVANLVHTFFDRLSSPNLAQRELAILALSEFVGAEELRALLAELFDSPQGDARSIDLDISATLRIQFEGDHRPGQQDLWKTAEQARLMIERGINIDLNSSTMVVSVELRAARLQPTEFDVFVHGYAIKAASARGPALAQYLEARTAVVGLVKNLGANYPRYRLGQPLYFGSSSLELKDLRAGEDWKADGKIPVAKPADAKGDALA